MRTYPLNNYNEVAESLTSNMNPRLLTVFESHLQDRSARDILGQSCQVIALATVQVTVMDGTPQAVELKWPIVKGDSEQLLFIPVQLPSLFVNLIVGLPEVATTIDIQSKRDNLVSTVVSAMSSLDLNNLAASIPSVIPLLSTIQQGVAVRVAVVDIKPLDVAETDVTLTAYLRRRFVSVRSVELPMITKETFLNPKIMMAAGPLLNSLSSRVGSGKDQKSSTKPLTPFGMLYE